MQNRTRRPIKYYGGKAALAPLLNAILPPHRLYVEAMLGSGALFFLKKASPVEVLNDCSQTLMTFYRAVQDPTMREQLMVSLEATLYSRAEFDAAKEPSTDPVQQARNFFVRSRQGFNGRPNATWSYSRTQNPARTFRNSIQHLSAAAERLQNVQLENRDVIEVIRRYDCDDALFFLDPPYVASTRESGSRRLYVHEMADEKHRELLDVIGTVRGAVILCGFQNEMYDSVLNGWVVGTKTVKAVGAYEKGKRSKPARVEALYLNAKASRDNPNFHVRFFDRVEVLG